MVVIPPYPNIKDSKSNIIVAKTAVIGGPMIAPLNPFPVGWVQLPVTEGNFKKDMTSINKALSVKTDL